MYGVVQSKILSATSLFRALCITHIIRSLNKLSSSLSVRNKQTRPLPRILCLFRLMSDDPLNQSSTMVNFGTQPFRLCVDNHSSYCISKKRTELPKGIVLFDAKVSSIRSSVTVRHKGKVQWFWEDDLGHTTVHDIPGTLFMPDSPDRILSPQHWAQVRASPDQDDSAHCITDPHSIRLVWTHGEHTKTFALDTHTNVAILRASPEVTLDALPNVVSDDKFDPGDPSYLDSVGDISFAHPSEGETNSHDSEGATNTAAIPPSPRTVIFDLGADSQPSVVLGDTYELEENLSPQQLYLLASFGRQ